MQQKIMAKSSRQLDLTSILKPAYFERVLEHQFPWKSPPAGVGQFYFGDVSGRIVERYRMSHRQVLKPLSTFAPTGLPSLLRCLPPPASKLFAEHALALVLTLDQFTRLTYSRSVNVRYNPSFFNSSGRALVHELLALPSPPDTLEAWLAWGYDFENAMIRRFWLYGPLIHSEEMADLLVMQHRIEAMRCEVENYAG
jgi:hypothetical protein